MFLAWVPHSWLETLAMVQDVCPGAVLAGGALRDIEHRMPASGVKDLDIFVAHSGDYTKKLAKHFDIQRRDHMGRVIMGDKVAEYKDVFADGVLSISEFPAGSLHTLPVQIIAVAQHSTEMTIESVVGRFDFGICRIGTDGLRVHWTDAYARDRTRRTFTLLRSQCEAQYKRSMERWRRISARFPQYSLVISPEIQQRIADGWPDPHSVVDTRPGAVNTVNVA